MRSFILRILRLLKPAYGILLFLVTAGILYLTLIPSDSLSPSRLWAYDKLGHAVAFGTWSFVLYLYYYYRKEGKATSIQFVTLSGIGFGALIELVQYVCYFLKRKPEWLDLLADGVGCLFAAAILYILYR